MSARPSTEHTNFCAVGQTRQIPADAAHGCRETSVWFFRASADACWTSIADGVPRGATRRSGGAHTRPCHRTGVRVINCTFFRDLLTSEPLYTTLQR